MHLIQFLWQMVKDCWTSILCVLVIPADPSGFSGTFPGLQSTPWQFQIPLKTPGIQNTFLKAPRFSRFYKFCIFMYRYFYASSCTARVSVQLSFNLKISCIILLISLSFFITSLYVSGWLSSACDRVTGLVDKDIAICLGCTAQIYICIYSVHQLRYSHNEWACGFS